MIQRIQTLYLIIMVVLSVVSMCTPVGHLHQSGVPVADFYNLWLTMADGTHVYTPWAMFVLLLLFACISLSAIFLFKKRMLQVRFTVFAGLLLVGYYLVFTYFLFQMKDDYASDFTFNWTMAFPAVCVILDYLAFRGIMKDEFIVRSLDRLR